MELGDNFIGQQMHGGNVLKERGTNEQSSVTPNPLQRSNDGTNLSESEGINAKCIKKSKEVKLSVKRESSDDSYSSDFFERVVKSAESFAFSESGEDLTKSELQKLKFSKIMDEIHSEFDMGSSLSSLASNAKTLKIVSEVQRFAISGYFEGMEDWEKILTSLEDIHTRRLKLNRSSRDEFPGKNNPRKKILNLLKKDIQRVKELKNSYLEEHKENVTDSTELSVTPYFSRDIKNKIFRKFVKESKLMEAEYFFLHKKYKNMEQRNKDLQEQIKNLAGVNDEINQTNRRLQTENNSLRGEKEWLQKQIFELKGGKSSANLISRLFKGKQK
ncbi:unnamed protein product [Moneuplotes crassus]|uniref:Uncharacterized protein n=1 Tax=Euplotes crassus TaxID=5936 RepID=A0AAD2CWX4_EUPCR|nr:unnamed protein product [Moneuplotes crassus]